MTLKTTDYLRVSFRWGRVWLHNLLTVIEWVQEDSCLHQGGKHTLLSLNASRNPGQNACSSWRLWKVNVRWIGEGSQNSKHHWNVHEFVSFFSWYLLGWSQKLPETWNCTQTELLESLFLECGQGMGGGPFGLQRVGIFLCCFCIALLFFFPVPSRGSSGSPIVDCCRAGKLEPGLSSQRAEKQAIYTHTHPHPAPTVALGAVMEIMETVT